MVSNITWSFILLYICIDDFWRVYMYCLILHFPRPRISYVWILLNNLCFVVSQLFEILICFLVILWIFQHLTMFYIVIHISFANFFHKLVYLNYFSILWCCVCWISFAKNCLLISQFLFCGLVMLKPLSTCCLLDDIVIMTHHPLNITRYCWKFHKAKSLLEL